MCCLIIQIIRCLRNEKMFVRTVCSCECAHCRQREECIGQGIGNIASGLTGGMGGCAMIGQTQALS